MHLRILSLLLVGLTAQLVAAEDTLRVLSRNVESRGSSSTVIADQLTELRGYHIVGLSEVSPRDFSRFARAVSQANGSPTRYVAGVTGGGARLMIIYDTDRLRLNSYSELFTHDGIPLNNWNHLARSDKDFRNQQATGLREWAKNQTLPLIAIGDYNFDYDFPTMSGNDAFDAFLQGEVWKWVKPEPLVDTNWADSNGDGADDYSESMLDFAFVGKQAKEWPADSRVVVRPGDFPDDMQTSDHRPVDVSIEPRR